MKLPKEPSFTNDTIKDMEDMTCFTDALIFDDLLIVAQKETACFVLKTSEGQIVIDAIWPDERAYHAIIDSIKRVGWDPQELKKLVLTHGHVDHTGCGRWFVKDYHVKTYLSKVDDEFWREHPVKPERKDTWKDYDITDYIKDGDSIILGDKEIKVYETPGHTPGCLSYIFPVTEDGQVHMAALLGGATPPWNGEGVEQFERSLDYFIESAREEKVDVILSNHMAIDNGRERIAYSRERRSYMPNIYCIGTEGVERYWQVHRTLCEEMWKRL